MTFKKILCPTDFSEGSDQALRVASRLANEHGAELVLVHAWFIPAIAQTLEHPYPPSVVQALVDGSNRSVEVAVEKAKASGAARVRGELVNGPAWSEIVAMLEGQGFDLCVIGTHGRTGFSRMFMGSVAERVVRHAPCSVLAVHPNGGVERFKSALVATDFSPGARHALELATKLLTPGGKLMLLHVLELPARFSGEVPRAAFDEEMNLQAAKLLAREADALKARTGVDVQTRLRIGYPGHEILNVLGDDPRFDLVATGSHGRTGIKRVLLGSVAEKVVRHARCPVLVARVDDAAP
jgi:nucleotide-binding universal stress UspA family protein